jgi:hypothetical protein
MIDTDVALTKITQLVKSKGAQFITLTLTGKLVDQEADLLQTYSADAIVNATGLGSWELAGDENVYPLRGAMIRVLNDNQHFKKVTTALAVSAEAEGHTETKCAPNFREQQILTMSQIHLRCPPWRRDSLHRRLFRAGQ